MKLIYTTLLILITSVCYGQAMFVAINIYGQDACNDVPHNCDSLIATFATKAGGEITAKELRLSQGLSIKSHGAYCRSKVLSYQVSLKGNEINNPGGYLSEQSKKLLSYAKPGDKLYFKFIKAKGLTDGSVRDLGTLSFIVK